MTKKEFINFCIQETKTSLSFLKSLYICLPCRCNHPTCKGWAMVSRNNPEEFKQHFKKREKEIEIIGLYEEDIFT